MLQFDPSKFYVPLSVQSMVPRNRSNLSTQFSAMAPRVISFDPNKPIRMHRDETVHGPFARPSHIHVESSTSYAPRVSSMSGITTKSLQDVSMSLYAVLPTGSVLDRIFIFVVSNPSILPIWPPAANFVVITNGGGCALTGTADIDQ